MDVFKLTEQYDSDNTLLIFVETEYHLVHGGDSIYNC